MNRRSAFVSLFFICLLLASCAPINQAKITTSNNFDVTERRIAVFAFQNSGYPGVDSDSSDRFSAHLMAMGYTVVERQHLQAIISELKLSDSSMVSPDNVRTIGQMLNVNTIVFGTVAYRHRPASAIMMQSGMAASRGATYRPESVSIRFVNVNTGEVVLSGYCKTTDDMAAVDAIAEKMKESIMRR